ncbi:SCO family protein [Brevibacillus humidisoli]|uniref:SCO family protein n=1 Tax=Brevibacillus humidisoli TaxID=2895522 RepID=UPI001E4550FB|nr:SCO family protein [Brevibacillus humidisoli]UFJ40909.1 SCO family protein [Brevibacillus humidisoli]
MSGINDGQQHAPSFWQKYKMLLFAAVMVIALAGVLMYKLVWSIEPIPVLKQMDNFTLQNMNGDTFNFDDTAGKVRLVSFIFTNCPDVCPATTHLMAQLQDDLQKEGLFGKEVVFVTVAFDHERDTPEALQKYAEAFGADTSGWYFVRGGQQEIKQVADMFGVYIQKNKQGLYDHSMYTFLIDGESNLRKLHGMASDLDLEELKLDIKQLVEE